MLLVDILLAVVVVWFVQRRWLTRRERALAKELKTNIKSCPIFGHTHKFFGTDEDRMRTLESFGRDAIEVGGVSKMLHFDKLFLNVADPAVAEILLSQCLEKHDLLKLMKFVVGNASLIAPVPIWRHRRKIDAPVFSTKNLVRYVETFSEQSIEMTELLKDYADGRAFSIWDHIAVCSVNTVCETTMGVKINFRGSEFLNAVDELWNIAALRMMQPWIRNKFVFRLTPSYKTVIKHKKTIFDFMKKIIKEKQALIENESNEADNKRNTNKHTSFLDLQLVKSDSSQKLSEQELLEETLQLVVAGYDSNATTTAFVVLMLGRHLDIQEKVYKELQEVFGDSDRAATYEDLLRLKYLDAVIKETLRLYPIAPVIVRQVEKDVKIPSGITIVNGCGVLVNVWAVHRNPAYWGEDADQFRPERFLDYTPKHPAAFMPFSYGPRGCFGHRYAMLMLQTLLSTFLRRYHVLAPLGVQQGEALRTKFEMLMKHADNYEIRLHRRQ